VPEPTQIVWSDEPNANVEHVAQHGVTPEEADEVICEYYDQRQRSRSHQHRWVVQGYTSAGRYLVVVFEIIDETGVILPITAFEPEN